MLSCILWYSL